MSKRRLSDIITELANETARDGYFGRKDNLQAIVNELIEELEYLKIIDVVNREDLQG